MLWGKGVYISLKHFIHYENNMRMALRRSLNKVF